MKHFKLFVPLSLAFGLTSCAYLHHAQVGDIDNRPGYTKKPFDIKVSESGVNLQEAAGIGKALMGKRDGEALEKAAAIVSLFQMGPRTGEPVYVKDYSKNVVQVIYEKCPSGNVTGLMSIRETRKYPVVSGEIVKITGYCLVPKEQYKEDKEG